jgi:amidase
MAAHSKAKQQRPWQDVAKEAQRYRDASIAVVTACFPATPDGDEFSELPKNSSVIPSQTLHPRDIQITGSLPEELIRALASGELSATDVTTAFLRQAALAQKLVGLFEMT